MKCPACGFDSPDDAAWCDFCKEPFRKGPPPPRLSPPATPPVPEGKRNGAPPAEFAHLDPGERIPTMPPWVRLAAWAFVGFWFVWGMVLLGFYLGKQRLAGDRRRPDTGSDFSRDAH